MNINTASYPSPVSDSLRERYLEISPIVFGCMRINQWNLDSPHRLDRIKAIMDLGLTSFDHADIYGDYGNEALFGDSLAIEPALRDRMRIITKCCIQLLSGTRPGTRVKHYVTSRDYILDSVDTSLSKLRTDYIDLLLIHRPDMLLDPRDVGEAFGLLLQAGKVRAFGVSNFSPSQYATLATFSPVPLVANQVEISPLHLQAIFDGTLDQCLRDAVIPMAWSPFAGGRLFDPHDECASKVLAAIDPISRKMGISSEATVLAWLGRLPAAVIPVVGTGDPARLGRMVAARSVRMDVQDWYAITEASLGHPVP